LQFYRDKGVDLVRLPFTWERMQPKLGGELSSSELGLLKTFLSDAARLGMDVIIDLHNYGRYEGQPIGSAGGPTKEQFADFWSKLAGEIKGFSSLVGYDLMNEPHDMPSASAWKDAAQAAVDAIRLVDTAKTIFVEGNNWSGAWSWLDNNADFIIKDPADKLVYQAHQYFDRDSSGTYAGSFGSSLSSIG
jgi:aryl-phospho-beta-D-glucosidase BglC (GH1 family)